jgi:hypothetical protein
LLLTDVLTHHTIIIIIINSSQNSYCSYIPAIFGVVLLAGVGVLTGSLGDVMDEEASLGLQSGARAKKEIERSRSSYFGKKR